MSGHGSYAKCRLSAPPKPEPDSPQSAQNFTHVFTFSAWLKRERIRRRTYRKREEARQDVFDYVEMFYNPVRKQVRNGMLSPVEFERQRILKAEGVQKSRGY